MTFDNKCPGCAADLPEDDLYSPPYECPGCHAELEWDELPDDPEGRPPMYVNPRIVGGTGAKSAN